MIAVIQLNGYREEKLFYTILHQIVLEHCMVQALDVVDSDPLSA